MIKNLAVLMMIGLVAVAIFGCSDETIVPNDIAQANTTGVIRGEIDPDDVEFEFKLIFRHFQYV